jgi:type I restriction enzyme S subunit
MNIAEPKKSWLGNPPEEWKVSRIRNVATLSPGYSAKTPKPDELSTVVPMELLSESGTIDVSNQEIFKDISAGLTLFERGDVLFAKITPCMENGKGAYVAKLSTRYAFGSTEFHVLRPGDHVDGRFLYYYTFNPTYRAYAAENMTGAAGQKRVSSRFLKDTRLFLPPIAEQEQIVAYLDASCAAIDAAVAAKLRQLETLDAVRESLIEAAVTGGIQRGVGFRHINDDWIGEIPAHWEVCRIKRVVSRVDYGISESTMREGTFPVLKMGNIQTGGIILSNIEFVDEVADDLLLEKGDLLYNRTNSPDQVGKAAVFRGGRTEHVTFASYLVRLRTNHRSDPYFLNYLLNCTGFLSFARKLAIPSVQQSNLNSTRYCRMLIPLPPLPEQRQIAEFLDEKTGELERVVRGIERQIDTLKAYRNSLIHECVTGQRRVTDRDLKVIQTHG